MLKRTVSSRRFFWDPKHMFWLKNKENNFQLHTLIWVPDYRRWEGFQTSSFLISKQKHMLWVLIGSVSMRRFQWVPQQMISKSNKKNLASFGQFCFNLNKAITTRELSGLCIFNELIRGLFLIIIKTCKHKFVEWLHSQQQKSQYPIKQQDN